MTDFRALCARMADELDHYRQLLMDDRRETHALATEARAALAQPELQAPTDEELSEFATDWWNGFAYAEQGADVATSVIDIIHPWHFADFSRDVLARWSRPTTEPVPVAERLPGPKDCDAEGRCWLLYRSASVNRTPTWSLVHRRSILDADYTHWLPHWALPVPKSNSITQGE